MTDRERMHIPTETLLYDNPVAVERSSVVIHDFRDERYKYDVKFADTGEVIGHTGIIIWADDTKELYYPTLRRSYVGRGFGAALYVAASQIGNEISNPLLQSHSNQQFLSESAQHVWESLVKRGLAEKLDTKRYRFLPLAALLG